MILKKCEKKGHTIMELSLSMLIMSIVLIIISTIIYNYSTSYVDINKNTRVLNNLQNFLLKIDKDTVSCYKVNITSNNITIYNKNGQVTYSKDNNSIKRDNIVLLDRNAVDINWEEVTGSKKNMLKLTIQYKKYSHVVDNNSISFEKYILTNDVIN